MRFGVHVSISGKSLKEVVKRAKERTCQTVQIFTRNPRGWALPKEYPKEEIEEFKILLKENNIYPLIVHLPYLPNIASCDEELYSKSQQVLISDIERAGVLGAEFVVVHAGSCKAGIDKGIELACNCINKALSQVKNNVIVLIENQAGGGSEIGYDFHQLKQMIDGIKDKNRVGICFDLCHVYVAGYDISTKESLEETLSLFDKLIGIDRIKLLHANDTDAACGSKLDRHQDIGTGKIGKLGFTNIVNHKLLKDLPVILETPVKTKEDDIRNLQTIRSYIV
jgi:deoxyribonuclease-4